jgi:glycosyltransferase involved in cell wall biosynthesis
VDGNDELYRSLSQKYAREHVRVITTGEAKPAGLAHARNVAIRHCTEDVISFLDDDATADQNWIANIAESIRKYDCVTVAGKTLPSWQAPSPRWLTPTFYWLVGATGTVERNYEHFVRSGFGSNMSCMRHALLQVGMFNPSFGMRGSSLLQAEEADLGLRIREAFGKEAAYNPKAIIFHKVDYEKLRLSYMFRRAYYQGNSKALLFNLHGRDQSILGAESDFLRLVSYEPIKALKDMFNGVSIPACVGHLLFSLSVTSSVLLGFIINFSAGGSRKLKK